MTAAPEGGKANDAVLRLLAERLDLPGKSLTLVSGPSSRDKIVELHGIDRAEAERRLAPTMPQRRSPALSAASVYIA